ncbi:MAG: hypothetical protein ABIA77_03020 [Candidatus Omnitrophota bacterium]
MSGIKGEKAGLILAMMLIYILCRTQHEAYPQVKTVYNCEQDVQNWEIPDWSVWEDDYVFPVLAIDKNFSNRAELGLKLTVSFPAEEWRAGIVETEGFFDLTLYRKLVCDIYLPRSAPKGIWARIIIVSGNEYLWIEMVDPVFLTPGRRTTVSGNLKYGNRAWRYSGEATMMTDELKSDIRKIAIRVESDGAAYKGPVYIDRIKLVK